MPNLDHYPIFRTTPSTSRLEARKALTWATIAPLVLLSVVVGLVIKPGSHASNHVPGQDYMICDNPATFLTSPWTYHVTNSTPQVYTVGQYQALSGYGTTLPPLPAYIAAEPSGSTAAIIYSPGNTTDIPAYTLPGTPILQFFEGGAYGHLGSQTISGDEFIGGSAPGFNEPMFDDANTPGGIDGGNDSYSFSGATTTLTGTMSAGATTVTTATPISNWASEITFADGATYSISGGTSTSVQISPALAASESGSVWSNSTAPIGKVSAAKAQGSSTLSVTSLTSPLVQWGNIVVGDQAYRIASLTGTQAGGYTLAFTGGLDKAVALNTPVYFGAAGMGSGGVTVSYLDISHDLHTTTGTLTIGSGWTITHNKIHDSYRNLEEGVAFYGGDESTIEYNCFSKMGSSGAGGSGTNGIFDYNEVYQAGFEGDPGCGCTGNKWWGSLNADIVDNAFVEVGIGGGTPAIWLDNGNSGTNITGNYFYHNVGNAVESETGFNLNVTNNLMVDDNWGYNGTGCGDANCTGEVVLNSSGGFHVPNSRYDNQVIVTGNQFINDWGGVTIWESGLRNCGFSGEGDSAYCTGGFPNTELPAQGGQYYFSHYRTSISGDTSFVDQAASAGSTTLLVRDAEAINDQIGFADPATTTTASTTNVTTLTGAQSITAGDTSGFPSSGSLRADTTALATGGNTGAVLSYTGKTATSFTGVTLVRGTGSLNGNLIQILPYKVVAQTCYANDCALTVSPALAAPVAAGTTVTSTGTCTLFGNVSTTTPTNYIAPNGAGSYYDGCQWGTKHITITSNDFQFDPTAIAAGTTATGHAVGANCNSSHTNECGTNFMMMQTDGELPFGTNIDGNAMFSNASFTTCPAWDSGCTSDPFNNLNSLSNAPSAPPSNGEAPSNNLWNNNTYEGPWAWNAWNYGPCNVYPTDPNTGKSVPSSPNPCSLLTFATWQADYQQDTASTYSPTVPSPTATPSSTPTPTATPTPTPSGKVGDLNNDGQVNIFDLSILLSAWGTNNAVADLDHNNTVNIFDLSIILSHWGT